MQKATTIRRRVTIGLDVSDRYSRICVLDVRGAVEREDRIRTTPEPVGARLSRYARARVVLEVGPHSPWLSRLLKAQGHALVVANPRRVRLIAEAERKSDRIDAETLARLGRLDPKLLRPIKHRGKAAQEHLALLRVREGLVHSRTRRIQCARGLAKALGVRLPTSSAPSFAKRVRERALEGLFPGLEAAHPSVQPNTSLELTANSIGQPDRVASGRRAELPSRWRPALLAAAQLRAVSWHRTVAAAMPIARPMRADRTEASS